MLPPGHPGPKPRTNSLCQPARTTPHGQAALAPSAHTGHYGLLANRGTWSWAASAGEAEARRAEARALVGRRVSRVRYFDIDYYADDFRHDQSGPRTISSEVEWAEPIWAQSACDSIDFAVEFETSDGAFFTVSWDPPGQIEGLGLRRLRAVGNAIRSDADVVAVWDVSDKTPWKSALDASVISVEMHYAPWDELGESLWCQWVTVELGSQVIDFVLGEGDRASSSVRPSADNVAVIFDRQYLPDWIIERRR